MTGYEMIEEYRFKHSGAGITRWYFSGNSSEWRTARRIVITESFPGRRRTIHPEGPWFDDMKVLVAKLRLLGIEVVWPGDEL